MPSKTPLPHASNTKPTFQRLKLSMPSPDRDQSSPDDPERRQHQASPAQQRPSTPTRPSYSPVTPTLTQATLAASYPPLPQPVAWIDEPDPLPVSLEENTDAIALRSAITILQLQRQRTIQDIRDLENTKAAATRDPKAFVDELKAGRLVKSSRSGPVDVDFIEDSSEEGATTASAENAPSETRFRKLPDAQNVVRMPHVNWAKYHVVGESLDKLHEEQRLRPSSGQQHDSQPNPEHVVAAPYSPWADNLDQPPMSRSC